MERPLILFKYSPLYSILCIALGILFAFILYRKQTLWSARINYFLFFLRATLVTFIAILLLSPFIKYLQNTFETPTVAIALDNSLSVSKALSTEDLMHFANTWKKDLEEKGFAVDFFTLEDELPLKTTDSIKTNASTTNITSLLASVENSYEGRNLSGVILASDGIINAGSSPEYKNYSFPISTVALGDTIPKTDLAIKNLRYNKFSYQGNKFPVVIDVYNVGFENSSALLTVSMGNNTKSSKVINFTKSREINTVEFELESNKTGLQQVSVSLEEKSGEYTYENNKKRFVIDVINGSEKILLVANSPHPDIQALRSVIEKNKNYSFHLYIPGISTPPASEKKYDLIILYQIPGLRGNAEEILKSLLIENTSFLYIIGNQTNLRKFNTFNTSIEIQSNQGEKDQVSSWYNSAFPHFELSDKLEQLLADVPPMIVPYGNYALKESPDILLYQKVGSIDTKQPLFITFSNEKKTGILLGEGLWKWKLYMNSAEENDIYFDELISKTIQYLSTKEDRRKFKLFPVKESFTENEPVIVDTELYNDLYEKIYGNEVKLSLTDPEGNTSNFSYYNLEGNSRYTVGNLDEGIYTYKGTTTHNGENYSVQGEFSVEKQNLELIDLTANHNLLRNLVNHSNGKFFNTPSDNSIVNTIAAAYPPKSVIHTHETFVSLINLPWVFISLLTLISLEWFLRKYLGSY